MRLEDSEGLPLEPPVPQPAVSPQAAETEPPRRSHLVVIVTRALGAGDTSDAGAAVRARYWNPHHHRWVEDDYESLESLRGRYLEEEGWELLQEQELDAQHAAELIFKAHRIDFTRPSREQILRDIGMTPDDVSQLLEDVDRRQERE
jgi:hypothetical protein